MITLDYKRKHPGNEFAEGTNGQQGATTSVTAAQAITQQSDRYPQPIGTVRAYPMSGGRELESSSAPPDPEQLEPVHQSPGAVPETGFAHSFAYGESNREATS